MKIFMDTEFTGLHQQTTLVSLALVSENNKIFYAELTDYNKNQLDSWLQENVIKGLFLDEDFIGVCRFPKRFFKSGSLSVSHTVISIYSMIYDAYKQGICKRVDYDHILSEGDIVFYRGSCSSLAGFLREWLYLRSQEASEKLVFWSDCLSYDWVLFNELFGGALNIPDFVSYIPMDICTAFQLKGIDPDISREGFCGASIGAGYSHNSLWDALIIRECYKKLLGDQFPFKISDMLKDLELFFGSQQ